MQTRKQASVIDADGIQASAEARIWDGRVCENKPIIVAREIGDEVGEKSSSTSYTTPRDYFVTNADKCSVIRGVF